MQRSLIVVSLTLLLLAPVALAVPRTQTVDYTYVFVPGAPTVTGCGALQANEKCFNIRPGDTSATVTLVDDLTQRVGFTLLLGAPGIGNVRVGSFCGSTPSPVSVGSPFTTLRVNFDQTSFALCNMPGTTGTITVNWV